MWTGDTAARARPTRGACVQVRWRYPRARSSPATRPPAAASQAVGAASGGNTQEVSMKLYGHPISTCTRKVLFTAQEKGHKLELVVVDLAKGEHKSADHLSRQPFGQVPALDDGGFALYESRAIARYLD